jgi:hypothetical protein
MSLEGHIQNGVVVFDEPVALPNGTPVRVELIAPTTRPDDQPTTLLERLGGLVGSIEDLPSDAARNVDHYLYGHPKK